MDNIVKARIISEILDDQKYIVLNSLSSAELNKLKSVDLDTLKNVSAADVSTVLNEFIARVEKSQKERNSSDTPPSEDPPEEIKKAPKMKTVTKEVKKSIADKIKEQPPQLIACLINKLDDDQKKDILSKLSKEQKEKINSIEVDKLPMFDSVLPVIMKELEIA